MESSSRQQKKENPYVVVYQATTIPLKTSKCKEKSVTAKSKKRPPRRDKSDLGENFIAPDGGWAWLVCIAAGVSNLTIYPCIQQFGFIFRERLINLGLTSSQITTIINTNPAVSACTGLLNGPMFRRFTFRQVAIAGSMLIFLGIFSTAFCNTFLCYMTAYSLVFGFGVGISISASSLAVNTYFKIKRRKAAGFAWTITGLGSIVLPYIATLFVTIFGVQGTVFIFAALSLHTFMAALIFQPVKYHAPKPQDEDSQVSCMFVNQPQHMCKYCERQQEERTGIFSSQYLYQDDDENKPGFEIIEPGIPMLSRANDGLYGSRLSLASKRRSRLPTISSVKDLENMVRESQMIGENEELKQGTGLKPNNFNRERLETLSRGNSFDRYGEDQLRCICAEKGALMELHGKESSKADMMAYSNEDLHLTCFEKIVTFFDLDLLRDFSFVNVVAGLTMFNFAELNFSILTPFILNDFGLEISQITLSISVLSGLDIITRFLLPFLTAKISWDNRIFFLIGVVGIAIGRTVVACTRSFAVIISTFAIIGVFKGVRTVFWPLIIPSCVPLKRLPAASGLQLLSSGIFTMTVGPFVGLVRDCYNYAITLHCLNAMTFLGAASWILEAFVRRYLLKPTPLKDNSR